MLLVFLAIPGHSAQAVPTITSLLHQRIVGGDSFRLIADGPIPKPFIESENKKLKIEFKGLDCMLPKGSKGHFATPVNGKLADRLEVDVEGTPRQTRLALRLTDGADYSYYYIKHSAEDIELLVIEPDKEIQAPPPVEVPEPQPPVEIPQPQPPVETPKPPQQPEIQPVPATPPSTPPSAPAPQIQQESGLSVQDGNQYRITKVEYFPLDEYGDRFVFSFESVTQQPDVEILNYPLRFEMTFPESEVRLPAKDKYAPFLTAVPGRGINQLKAWNRNSGQSGSVFELVFDQNAAPKWEIEQVPPNKIQVDISYEKPLSPPEEVFTPPSPPEAIEEKPLAETQANSVNGLKVGKQLQEVLASQAVILSEMEFELNWPQDADKFVGQLRQIIAGFGPGVVVEMPLKLRLHIGEPDSTIPYTKMEP